MINELLRNLKLLGIRTVKYQPVAIVCEFSLVFWTSGIMHLFKAHANRLVVLARMWSSTTCRPVGPLDLHSLLPMYTSIYISVRCAYIRTYIWYVLYFRYRCAIRAVREDSRVVMKNERPIYCVLTIVGGWGECFSYPIFSHPRRFLSRKMQIRDEFLSRRHVFLHFYAGQTNLTFYRFLRSWPCSGFLFTCNF